MHIESALIDRLGDVGRKLHTARSRNDQIALDLRLWMRAAAAQTLDLLENLQKALVRLGRRGAALSLPGYTHLQRALPVTAGHHMLAYVEMLDRDRGRVQDAARRAISDLLELRPEITVGAVGAWWPISDGRSRDCLLDGLRRAGLRE